MLTHHLLTAIARAKKKVLYIMLTEYQKSYDRVDIHKCPGCGGIFLVALQHSTEATGTTGMESFASTPGVKQGVRSSVRLFTT